MNYAVLDDARWMFEAAESEYSYRRQRAHDSLSETASVILPLMAGYAVVPSRPPEYSSMLSLGVALIGGLAIARASIIFAQYGFASRRKAVAHHRLEAIASSN